MEYLKNNNSICRASVEYSTGAFSARWRAGKNNPKRYIFIIQEYDTIGCEY